MSAQAISATLERFAKEPVAARTAPAVKARVVDGRAELSAGPFTWQADLPLALGGGNAVPSPTAYLLDALAGCAVTFIRDSLAPQLGVQIDDVSAVARCTSDMRGLLAMDGVAPDLGDIAIEISVESTEPAERLEALYQAWLERCPIYLAILKPNAVQATFSILAKDAR